MDIKKKQNRRRRLTQEAGGVLLFVAIYHHRQRRRRFGLARIAFHTTHTHRERDGKINLCSPSCGGGGQAFGVYRTRDIFVRCEMVIAIIV